jgi:chemotaxis protein MotB
MAGKSEGEQKRPIIIVKRSKGGGGGHHGGAWKVAYADFVTAMMAFFMVMWLVTAVSKEQRAAIFDYFQNPSMEPGKSVKPAPGMMGPGGASTSPIDLGGGMDAPRTTQSAMPGIGAVVRIAGPPPLQTVKGKDGQSAMDFDAAKAAVDDAERKQLESLMKDLQEAIAKSQALEPFKDQLLLDITPEGLRIQIIDKQNRPMFDLGGSRLKPYTETILTELSKYLNSVPNRLSLTGHTDATPFPGSSGRTNWDLSADRANAARRALEAAGLSTEKTARVVGLSSSVLFDKKDPRNPINRRISIIVMTRQAQEDAVRTEEIPSVAKIETTDTTAPTTQEPSKATDQ